VCRLRDIQDLFAGTGVNPKAYALMDQDRLNHVLTAKPWERRIFIEEAAGVARYKQQRGETQGKLDATRQNLQRVRDVMDEVKRQVGSLERQARKAQQYKALHQERQSSTSPCSPRTTPASPRPTRPSSRKWRGCGEKKKSDA
jgi:chromosome segregation protein